MTTHRVPLRYAVVAGLALHFLPSRPAAQLQAVPGAPRESELRFVVRRYTLDRQTLDANYAGSPARIGRPRP